MEGTAKQAPVVLLTGATGFVGRHLYPELVRSGCAVRCLTRDVERARARWPDRQWVGGDVGAPGQVEQALDGCDAAFYLVHGMAEGGSDFRTREVTSAERFAAASAASGVRRIVYLGGLEPQGPPSEHLASRLEVGEALRAGRVTAVELRASMIIGHGSLSWLIVRDLAARLPAMVLPRWLNSRTQPVAIRDVVLALAGALEVPLPVSAWFDIPGPDILTGREILEETAELMGLRRPVMVQVPVLSPWLSSHWVRFVTRAEWSVAREIVVGLAHDFLAHDGRYWDLIGHRSLLPFREAARLALAAEREDGPVPGNWGAIERWVARVCSSRAPA